jgi:hypothetical protein
LVNNIRLNRSFRPLAALSCKISNLVWIAHALFPIRYSLPWGPVILDNGFFASGVPCRIFQCGRELDPTRRHFVQHTPSTASTGGGLAAATRDIEQIAMHWQRPAGVST